MNQANAGLDKLKEYVDAVIVVPNDKLLQVVGREYGLLDSFGVVDEVLLRGVQGLTDIITVPGIINVDFADVKSVMQNSGSALMGIGKAQGSGVLLKRLNRLSILNCLKLQSMVHQVLLLTSRAVPIWVFTKSAMRHQLSTMLY